MKKKLTFFAGILLLISVGTLFFLNNEQNSELTIEQQREAHAKIIANSPFKESLTWDKKKRKKEGLPPNRYFEQMWELTVNPSTGKLDDGELTLLRQQLELDRIAGRNPGEAGNDWDERGPNDIGGRTRAILFDPNDPSGNIVYAGGVSGGLWRNTNITNSGSQWERLQNIPGNLSVTSITVDPNNSNRWYVGTGEQYTAGDVVGTGVYVTNDGGNTWNSVNIPPAGPGTFEFNASNLFLSGIFYVNDIVAWDNNGNTELFVGVGAHVYGASSSPTNWLGLQTAGLYRSTNDGATWNRIETSNLQFDFAGTAYPIIPNDFEIGADNTLWMGTITTPGIGGTGGGRVFSTTTGSSWTEAGASPLTDSNRVEIAVSASNPNKMYALTQGVNTPVHVYTSNNRFGSISNGALPNDADQGIPANDFCRGQAFYDLMIEVDPNNDNIVYVGGIDLFRSTNSASSWTQISKWSNNPGLNTLNVPFVHADQHAMTFRPGNSNQAVFGNDGGIYYASSLSAASGNGSAIGVRNNNYNVTQYVKAGIGPNGSGTTNVIFTAGAQDNGSQAFRNANASPGINGSEELSDGDGFYTFVDKDGQYMIATFVANVIYRFNLPWNGLGRRQGGATTLSNDQSRGDFVNQMDYDSDANRLLTNNSNSTQNAIKSINVASNSSGSLTNSLLTAEPSAFRASPFANNVWYVGLKNGDLIRLSNVNNNSASWTSVSTPFLGSVSSIRFGETANDIFVTIHNYGVTSVWATSNGGSNWVSKEGDLPNIPVRDMLQNPLNRDEAILATQLGVWSTSNFNATNPNWSQAYNGMSDVSVTSFDYWAVNGNDNNNQIIASTYGRGVFTGSFTATAVPDTEAPSVPSNLTASNTTQNSTDLTWTASTDNVGVSGYDILQDGSVVASVSGTTTNYQVTGLSPNTSYAFRVRANDAAGNQSGNSNVANVTTDAPDTTAPSVPTNLIASGVTSNSVNLSWTASTDNVGVASYDVLRNSTVIGNTTNTSFTVTGLTPETQYTFTVVAKDATGNVSGESNSATITTDAVPVTYCSSQSSNVNDEYISRVQLNTIDNSSGAQFYSDFTSQSTTLTKGSQYTVTITPTWTGTLYNEGYSVWIDYNRDGDFTDANEQVFTQAPTQATPVSGSFTVPNTASEVSTRMRVTMSYNATVGPCASFTYGEVEDYTIIIEGTGPDTEAPVITLNGAATVNLNVGETYTELGATATDNVDGDVTGNVIIGGDTVNTNIAGSYIVTYNVSDAAGNAANEVTRTVNVNADITAPVITLNGPSSVILELGQAYNEQGATATDNIDGDISANIVIGGDTVNTNAAGSYIVTYNVSDAAGNAANQVTRTVTVNPDSTAPVITLIGASIVDLNVGDTYTEQGATASDNIDGNISANIVIGGDTVNTSLAGTYIVTYNVSDAAGNAASQVTRTVNVNEVSSGCTGGISTFPYTESFESGDGWTQVGGDDGNWVRNSGSTPSNTTGPSSAANGSFYMFLEASTNNSPGQIGPNATAILVSPCFDLTAETAAVFTFQNHLYGTNIGTLSLEVSTDEGKSWTSIWNLSGNQGNQWNQASVDLASYTGQSITLRFVGTTGSSWRSDIAIDNLELNADDGSGSSGCDVLNFNDYTLNSFSTQDTDGSNSIGNGGTSLTLSNNTWKYINFPYTVTANTVIELEFSSTSEGEIHGIGFENDNALTSSFYFKFYGTQNYGVTNFDNYSNGTVTYVIPVGDSYTGSMDRLVFINDNDAGSGNNSTFSNVKIYETSCSGTTAAIPFGTRDDELGDQDETNANAFAIYPNPVDNVLHVKSNFLSEETTTYRIINMLGQTVARGDRHEEINVRELEEGVYFIELATGDDIILRRFVKQ